MRKTVGGRSEIKGQPSVFEKQPSLMRLMFNSCGESYTQNDHVEQAYRRTAGREEEGREGEKEGKKDNGFYLLPSLQYISTLAHTKRRTPRPSKGMADVAEKPLSLLKHRGHPAGQAGRPGGFWCPFWECSHTGYFLRRDTYTATTPLLTWTRELLSTYQ